MWNSRKPFPFPPSLGLHDLTERTQFAAPLKNASPYLLDTTDSHGPRRKLLIRFVERGVTRGAPWTEAQGSLIVD